MQLRSSVRRTQNDARYFNRDLNQVKNLLGLEAIESDKEESADDQVQFIAIDQKNIFTSLKAS